MGLMHWLFGAGAARTLGAAGQVAEVFVPNASRRQELQAEARAAAMAQHAAEFRNARTGAFDRAIDGLNRLPRPLLALGTIGLFAYAMADPASFAVRMRGLAEVPEPLWWLLGAVVGFYFGAREAHHFRLTRWAEARRTPDAEAPAASADGNAALAEWRALAGR
ncbi:MAG: holin family protein [Rhodobacteraceae bacterium]|nr:holin family protein [Paracoccaceae bacterium]